METVDFEKILRQSAVTRPYFAGVYSADRVCKKLFSQLKGAHKPFFCIVNTDTSDGRGEHWLSVYVTDNNAVEIFDPLGLAPYAYKNLIPCFEELARDNDKSLIFNNRTVQGSLSSVCGAHCIFFVYKKLTHNNMLSMEDLIDKYYTSNVDYNDCMVFRFIQKYFDIASSIKRMEKNISCK